MGLNFAAILPMKQTKSNDIVLQVKYFAGRHAVKYAYSDNENCIVKAFRTLQVPHRRSIPYEHENNTIIEGHVGLGNQAIRCTLDQMGAPSAIWDVAAHYVNFARVITPSSVGVTAYFSIHKRPFKGKYIPPGARIWFKPHPESNFSRKYHDKFSTAGWEGVFMGYDHGPAFEFTGGYLVAWKPEIELVDLLTGEGYSKYVHVQNVKTVSIIDEEWYFPLQAKVEEIRRNCNGAQEYLRTLAADRLLWDQKFLLLPQDIDIDKDPSPNITRLEPEYLAEPELFQEPLETPSESSASSSEESDLEDYALFQEEKNLEELFDIEKAKSTCAELLRKKPSASINEAITSLKPLTQEPTRKLVRKLLENLRNKMKSTRSQQSAQRNIAYDEPILPLTEKEIQIDKNNVRIETHQIQDASQKEPVFLIMPTPQVGSLVGIRSTTLLSCHKGLVGTYKQENPKETASVITTDTQFEVPTTDLIQLMPIKDKRAPMLDWTNSSGYAFIPKQEHSRYAQAGEIGAITDYRNSQFLINFLFSPPEWIPISECIPLANFALAIDSLPEPMNMKSINYRSNTNIEIPSNSYVDLHSDSWYEWLKNKKLNLQETACKASKDPVLDKAYDENWQLLFDSSVSKWLKTIATEQRDKWWNEFSQGDKETPSASQAPKKPPREFPITSRLLANAGMTSGCPACEQIRANQTLNLSSKIPPHSDECRENILSWRVQNEPEKVTKSLERFSHKPTDRKTKLQRDRLIACTLRKYGHEVINVYYHNEILFFVSVTARPVVYLSKAEFFKCFFTISFPNSSCVRVSVQCSQKRAYWLEVRVFL